MRSLMGWDAAVAILLLGTWRMMATTSVSELRLKAAQQDENATVILMVMIAAIAASLLGIVAELSNARRSVQPAAEIALPLCTIVLSWLCMHVLFAIHYAHLYYSDSGIPDPDHPGLIFPEKSPAPSYLEFVYFSFCIGMTYQVSDVMAATKNFRRLITLHGVLSFFYNTFVLALAVSLFSALPGLP
jgi:uncharacterized membrane protein